MTHNNQDAVYRDAYTLFSIVDNAIKPKFSGTPTNIPLNAVMFAYKGIGYPILWNAPPASSPITSIFSTQGIVLSSNMILTNASHKQCII
ncbi:MAG: hypothetical protein EZS28_050854, partial [Streblomastix strix]